jgi:hypothetical protein
MTLRFLTSLLAALATASVAAAAEPRITDVHLIPIGSGVNVVPHFAADGRAATIVKGWRENGNSYSYNVYLVLLPGPGRRPQSVVQGVVRNETSVARGVVRSDTENDLLTDGPFDDEQVEAVVWFARARLNGVRQTILITARLDDNPNGVRADPDTATITVYRLAQSEGVGQTPDYFQFAWQRRTTARYCNVNLAASAMFHVPLPSDYAGLNKTDGC